MPVTRRTEWRSPQKSPESSPVKRISELPKANGAQRTPTKTRKSIIPERLVADSPSRVRTPTKKKGTKTSYKSVSLKSPRLKAGGVKKPPPKQADESSAESDLDGQDDRSKELIVARELLHTSNVPKSLPCRESEFTDIYEFIRGRLSNAYDGIIDSNSGGCMYVSGVPGTGKTATVHEVVRSLTEELKQGNCGFSPFKFVEINGLRLMEPHQAYVQILNSITATASSSTTRSSVAKRKISAARAAEILDDMFSRPSSKKNKEHIVLLVDELDQLCTKKQHILYHIFDWPQRSSANLTVIAIANAMDLPERVMINRVSSRLGLTRLTFHPYTYQQLQTIVLTRLAEFPNLFHPDCVQLVARRVAAVSGDARRALDICRRSAELAYQSANALKITITKSKTKGFKLSPTKTKTHLVIMTHVNDALQEMFSAPKIVAMKQASQQEQTLLKAIVAEFQSSGVEESTIEAIYERHLSICNFEGNFVPTLTEFRQIVGSLEQMKLLLVDSFSSRHSALHRRVRLNVSPDDVQFAMSQQ